MEDPNFAFCFDQEYVLLKNWQIVRYFPKQALALQQDWNTEVLDCRYEGGEEERVKEKETFQLGKHPSKIYTFIFQKIE